MEGALAESYTGHMACSRPIDRVLHQPAPGALVCTPGSTDIGPMPTIVDRSSKKLLPIINLAVPLGNDAIESRVVDHHAEQTRGDLGGGEVVREPMLVVDGTECIVTNTATRGGIIGRGWTQRIHGLTSLTSRNHRMGPRRSVNR